MRLEPVCVLQRHRAPAPSRGSGYEPEDPHLYPKDERTARAYPNHARSALNSNSHRCHRFEVAFLRELTSATIHLPLDCFKGGCGYEGLPA